MKKGATYSPQKYGCQKNEQTQKLLSWEIPTQFDHRWMRYTGDYFYVQNK